MEASSQILPGKKICTKRNDNGLSKCGLTSAQTLIFLSSVANVVWENALVMTTIQ